MSITGNKKRKVDCATLNVGADAWIGDDLYVGDNLTVKGTVTADQFAGGPLTPSFILQDGSVTDPALAFASDLKTGFYKDSPTGMAIAVNGQDMLHVLPDEVRVRNADLNVVNHKASARTEK